MCEQVSITKKTLRESNSLQGLYLSPEINQVDTEYIAAHFQSGVVWGLNTTNRVFPPKQPKPCLLLANQMRWLLSHIKTVIL